MTNWPKQWSETILTETHSSSHASMSVPGIGFLDEAGVVVEGGVQRGWALRGWAAFEREWSPYAELTLLLLGDHGSFAAQVVREPRSDVSAAFGLPVYLHSGYCALIPVEPMTDGDYAVVVEARFGSRLAHVYTGHVLRVRDGSPWLAERGVERLMQVVHVPKTAGSSFGSLLGRAFGSSLVRNYDDHRLVINGSTRCIIGHHYASSLLRIDPKIRMVMWFRDPVERVVSEYFHWRRNPATHPLGGDDLLSFARRRAIVNTHRRCLDGVPLERIDCVCITENFRASLELFCRWSQVGLAELPPDNTNPDKVVGSRYELSDSLREQLARVNRADLELYERAKERFALQCRQHGVQLAGSGSGLPPDTRTMSEAPPP